MKAWRGTDGDLAPVEKECEVFGYPNRTTDGEAMYINTHFCTEGEAWESILRSVSAGVKLAGGDVKDAKERLAKAERQAGAAAVEFKTAHDNYKRWKAAQE